MGDGGGGARPHLWSAVAELGLSRRLHPRPDIPGPGGHPRQPGLAPPGGVGLESGGPAPGWPLAPGECPPGSHGPGALSLPVPVLCPGGAPVLPALSAQRRSLPGGALQHRQLCPADPYDGPAMRSGAGRFRPYLRRSAPLPQSPHRGHRLRPARPRAQAQATTSDQAAST